MHAIQKVLPLQFFPPLTWIIFRQMSNIDWSSFTIIRLLLHTLPKNILVKVTILLSNLLQANKSHLLCLFICASLPCSTFIPQVFLVLWHFVFCLVLLIQFQVLHVSCIFMRWALYTISENHSFHSSVSLWCVFVRGRFKNLQYLECWCSTNRSCVTEGHTLYFSGGTLLILTLYC